MKKQVIIWQIIVLIISLFIILTANRWIRLEANISRAECINDANKASSGIEPYECFKITAGKLFE